MVTVPTAARKVGPNTVRTPSAPNQFKSTSGVSSAAFGGATAAATAQLGEGVQDIGAQVASAAIKIQQRKNNRERQKAYGQYQSETADEYRRVLDQDDLTDDATGQKFNAFITQKRAELTDNHQGGPLSAAELDNLLITSQAGLSTKMTDAVFEAHKEADDLATEQAGAEIYAQSFRDLSQLQTAMDQADLMVENFASAKSPQQKKIMRRILRSQALQGAFDNMLASGDWEAVQNTIHDNPDAARILGQKATSRILSEAKAIQMGTDGKGNISVVVEAAKREAIMETFGEGVGDMMVKTINDGLLARRQISDMQVQTALLDRVDSGTASSLRLTIGRAAVFMGASNELTNKMGLGDIAAAETFQAFYEKQAIDIIQSGQGARSTNLLITTIKGALARLGMSEQGNRLLLGLKIRIADARIAESAIVQKYAKFGNIDQPGEPGMFAELAQLAEEQPIVDQDFVDLVNAAVAEVPNNWQEFAEQIRGEAAAEVGITVEDFPAIADGVKKTFGEGWTFIRLTNDGKMLMENLKMDPPLVTINKTPREFLDGLQGAAKEDADEGTPNPSVGPVTPADEPRGLLENAATVTKAVADAVSEVTDDFFGKLRGSEGVEGDPLAKNPESTAQGDFQFINPTWIEEAVKHLDPELTKGMDPNTAKGRRDLLKLRESSENQEIVARGYAAGNAKMLEAAGFVADNGALSLAHFAGPTGAINLKNVPPDTLIREVLSKDAMEANANIKNKAGKRFRLWTAADIIEWAEERVQ